MTGGRWPANVILTLGAAELLDEQSGILHSQNPETRKSKSKRVGTTGFGTGQSIEYADKGGASRFFLTAGYEPWELEWIIANGLTPCGLGEVEG